MVSYLTNLLSEIKEVFVFFLEYVFGGFFSYVFGEPTLIIQIFFFCACVMSCLGLLIDFLIDHNHLFAEYMKDSADVYVRDRKQREKEAERDAKYEARRQKYRAQNKQDFIERQDEIDRRFAEKQKKIKETQEELFLAKRKDFTDKGERSYDIQKAIDKANDPLNYDLLKKKKKK